MISAKCPIRPLPPGGARRFRKGEVHGRYTKVQRMRYSTYTNPVVTTSRAVGAHMLFNMSTIAVFGREVKICLEYMSQESRRGLCVSGQAGLKFNVTDVDHDQVE